MLSIFYSVTSPSWTGFASVSSFCYFVTLFTGPKGVLTLTSGNLITTKWSVSSLTVESDKYSHDGMKVGAWEQGTGEPLQLGYLLSNSCRSITCVTCNTNTVYNIVPPLQTAPFSVWQSQSLSLDYFGADCRLFFVVYFCCSHLKINNLFQRHVQCVDRERHKPLSLLLVLVGI